MTELTDTITHNFRRMNEHRDAAESVDPSLKAGELSLAGFFEKQMNSALTQYGTLSKPPVRPLAIPTITSLKQLGQKIESD